MSLDIRKAQTQSEYDAVFRLRYEVYIEELGRVQRHVDHDARTIEEPLDRCGHVLCAFDGERLVGTLRSNYTRESQISYYEELYAMSAVGAAHPYATSITTKLLVMPAYRRSTVAFQLAMATYQLNLMHGIEHDFVDVYPERVPFFTRLGYRMHRTDVVHPEYGAVAVMRLGLHDESHLRSVDSPFLALLLQRESAAA